MFVTQYRKVVVKVVTWVDNRPAETVDVRWIWIDSTVMSIEEEQDIAREFGGDYLAPLPRTVPANEFCRTVRKRTKRTFS